MAATHSQNIDTGVIVRCYGCQTLVRETIYRHQCDIRTELALGLPTRFYCFSCMVERARCKRCGEPYAKLFNAFTVSSNFRNQLLRNNLASETVVSAVADRFFMDESDTCALYDTDSDSDAVEDVDKANNDEVLFII